MSRPPRTAKAGWPGQAAPRQEAPLGPSGWDLAHRWIGRRDALGDPDQVVALLRELAARDETFGLTPSEASLHAFRAAVATVVAAFNRLASALTNARRPAFAEVAAITHDLGHLQRIDRLQFTLAAPAAQAGDE